MSERRPSVVYVLPDSVGGLLTIIANLLQHRRPDEFEYRAVLTHNRFGTDARFTGHLAADRETAVEFAMPLENIHAVARRLARAIGDGPGVLVCNDFAEMLLLSILDPGRTVVQILHGDYDYYYDLAVTHEPLVHAFVAYSRTVYETLCERLPQRRDSIFWLSYGVPIPARVRAAAPGPVRLIFVGRLDESKGVFDLPGIDRALRALGVVASWTVVGNGPAGPALHARWPDESVRWVPNATVPEVAALCAQHDVFVLPSHAEGLSVATMEAMSAGVVPVVSDLRSMAEIVEPGQTGYRVPLGDPAAFAEVIAGLARDRDRLEAVSRGARQVVVDRFDIRSRAQAYQDLYARWRELYRSRPARVTLPYGSRLDQPWIPNAVVRAVRSAVRMVR